MLKKKKMKEKRSTRRRRKRGSVRGQSSRDVMEEKGEVEAEEDGAGKDEGARKV